MTVTLNATTPAATLTFRDMFAGDLPAWLNGPISSRYIYAMGVVHDAMGDAAIYAVQARFPSLAPEDAFTWLQQDRQIDRGFQEPLDSYRARLRQWLDLWVHAGSAWGMALAMSGYLLPSTAIIRTIGNNSLWDTLPAGDVGPPEHQRGDSTGSLNWDWDSEPAFDPSNEEYAAKWYRFWVVIYPGSDLWTKTRTYGDGMRYGDGSCYGYSGNISQTNSLRAIARKWRGAHNIPMFIILCFDPDPFDPDAAVSYGSTGILPDGAFESWGHRSNDTYVPYRAIIGLGTSFGVNAASYIDVPL